MGRKIFNPGDLIVPAYGDVVVYDARTAIASMSNKSIAIVIEMVNSDLEVSMLFDSTVCITFAAMMKRLGE